MHHQELVSCFRLDLTFKETRHGKHRKSSEEFVPSFAVLAASPKRLLRTASDLRSFSCTLTTFPDLEIIKKIIISTRLAG